MADEADLVEIPNPAALLSGELVSGFELQDSYILREGSADIVCEGWVRPSSVDPRRGTHVRVTLYPVGTQQEAFDLAVVVYYAQPATPTKFVAINSPRVGSYSGRPLGDFCWSYRWTPEDQMGTGPRPARNRDSDVVVVTANNLFCVQVSSLELVEDAFTEALAEFIVTRLKTWPRPER